MPVRGVSPSYFAGMPTVARDPRAGQPDAGYAAMPGQALSEANALNQRRHEFDSGEAFRAREQGHREQQDATSGAREDRRLGMYQQGEDRRQAQQGFENDRLKSADTRKLVQAMQAAIDDGEDGIAEALAAELKSRGWGAKPISAQPAAAPPGAPTAPPGTGAPEIGSQDMSWIEAGKGTNPMSPADAATSKQLDQAGASILPKLRGNVSPKKAGDADIAAELDAAENKYMGALQGKPKALLPGKRMRTGVAQSDAMLSPDDPLNKIVQ